MKLKSSGNLVIVLCGLFLTLGASQLRAEVQVHDANGQYLGILVDAEPWGYTVGIFVPSLSKMIHIEGFKGDLVGPDEHVFYDNNTCSGTPYCDFRPSPDIILGVQGKYYSYDSVPTQLEIAWGRPGCSQRFWNVTLFKLKEFTERFPFTLPVAFPLRLRYSPWEVSADGKIGLEEAVYSLQVVSGLRKPQSISNMLKFMGLWKGNGTFAAEGESWTGTVTLDLSIAGNALVGTLALGTETPKEVTGTVTENTLAFPVPCDDPANPACSNWDFSATATLDEGLTTMSLNVSGTVCGPGGGKPGALAAILTKTLQ